MPDKERRGEGERKHDVVYDVTTCFKCMLTSAAFVESGRFGRRNIWNTRSVFDP